MSTLRVEPEARQLCHALAHGVDVPTLHWLGQAGFALQHAGRVILIDPYLSDALAIKYAGTSLPHHRMMPAPVGVEDLPRIDAILVTHRHGDHMDRIAIPQIAELSPNCRIVLPRAELRAAASALAVDQNRFVPMEAGEAIQLAGITIHAIPAAHEIRERSLAGHDHFLGYVLELGESTLYHSGDCVPFEGLASALAPFRIDLALLPVNGRDQLRAAEGIPGNFKLTEATGLCLDQSIPAMIAHHFGMFAFNTIDRKLVDEAAAGLADRLLLLPASTGVSYRLEADLAVRNAVGDNAGRAARIGG